MRVRGLSDDGDMRFGAGGSLYLVDSAEAVAQIVMTRLKLWVGEWFIDTSEGTAWATGAIGERTRDTIEPMLRARILDTPAITGIDSFDLVIDAEARAVAVRISVLTSFGPTTVQGVL